MSDHLRSPGLYIEATQLRERLAAAEARATAAERDRDEFQRQMHDAVEVMHAHRRRANDAEEALADIDRRLDIHPCAETGTVHAAFGAAEHCIGCQIRERIAAARRRQP